MDANHDRGHAEAEGTQTPGCEQEEVVAPDGQEFINAIVDKYVQFALMDRKHELLTLLKVRGSAGLTEIAEHLGLSKQGTLRHVEALQARGLVEVSTEPHRGPGRPANVYRLTPAAQDYFPSGYRQLAAELVDFMEAEELERFFADRARKLEAEYGRKLAGLNFEERARALAQLTTEQGHMTEVVERPDGGIQLRHCNCPIQDVAARGGHPCRHEQEVYKRVLGAMLARSTWLGAGDTTCTYEIPGEARLARTNRRDIG